VARFHRTGGFEPRDGPTPDSYHADELPRRSHMGSIFDERRDSRKPDDCGSLLLRSILVFDSNLREPVPQCIS